MYIYLQNVLGGRGGRGMVTIITLISILYLKEKIVLELKC